MAKPAKDESPDSNPKSKRTIAVTNLSDTLNEVHLKDLFNSCGKIELINVKFILSKGRVCYIRFADSQSALAAQTLSGSDLDGKTLVIELVDDSVFSNFQAPSNDPIANGTIQIKKISPANGTTPNLSTNPTTAASISSSSQSETQSDNPNQPTLTRLNQVWF